VTDILAQNRDRQLRVEQTYDILNFENKLKGLESHSDYPKEKPWYFRPGKDTKTDFNILSNISMQEHHFAAPDKRPPADPAAKQRGVKVTGKAQREFDLVSNRYVVAHDEKTQLNDDIYRAEAAQKFWKTRDYNPLSIEYYDKEKETTFQKERDEAALSHGKDFVKRLPVSVQR